MADGRKIKATPTRTGADGTGYFRGNDGRYYYGNKKNGYLTETTQSRAARGAGEKSAASRPSYAYPPPSSIPKTDSFLALVVSIICTDWILTFFAVFIALAALFAGTLYSWPFLLSLLFLALVHGPINAGSLLLAAGLFALLAAMGIIDKVR